MIDKHTLYVQELLGEHSSLFKGTIGDDLKIVLSLPTRIMVLLEV